MTRIPAHVALLRDFVNTVELDEKDSDEIATPEGLATWLAEHGLGDQTATRGDVERACAAREALRALLMANNDLPVDSGAARATLEEAARRGRVELRFDDRGRLTPAATASGTAAALGTLVAAASLSMQDGTWSRLKACRADTCHWAFYDQARNHSRTWCSMEVCGNRNKVRAYRHRHTA
jgi:predicted RNA-binding Zn ribbon-like protein